MFAASTREQGDKYYDRRHATTNDILLATDTRIDIDRAVGRVMTTAPTIMRFLSLHINTVESVCFPRSRAPTPGINRMNPLTYSLCQKPVLGL
ncbi:MAG: hypothetical protein ABIQ08_05125, partial [Duganella sp.]